MKRVNCVCCDKKLDFVMSGQKYCVNCSLFVVGLKKKLRSYEFRHEKQLKVLKDLRKKVSEAGKRKKGKLRCRTQK